MKIKTLLVDDSIAFLTVATRFLATQPIELIGRVHSGHEAIQMCKTYHPQLVLLDLDLGDTGGDDLSGLMVLQKIKSQPNPPRVVIVSLHDQDEYRNATRLAGADGFVSKREFVTAFAPLIHSLFNDSNIATNLSDAAS
jgi:DNA-binding NarL/FixJ family response regulator